MLSDRGRQKLESEYNEIVEFACVITEKPEWNMKRTGQ